LLFSSSRFSGCLGSSNSPFWQVGKRRAEARAVRMARLREEDGGGDDDHDEL